MQGLVFVRIPSPNLTMCLYYLPSPKDRVVRGGSDDENLMDLADLHILDFGE